ncbi:hypothetical protein Alg130_05003 [Pyrenophora tritici-repentis]|nr:hypothetical protein Alg130_05003 [Pyrenophora tritici-repentis]
MKLISIITPACLLGIAASVDMSKYTPKGSGVDVGFKAFLKEQTCYQSGNSVRTD